MRPTTAKSFFWRGCLDAAPIILVATPFGMLFGVLATEAGLSIFESMTFTITVFAGGAQFTALQLLQENAPTLVIIASALAVNLRLAMYSAALTPYLGAAPLWQRSIAAFFTVDQSYALSVVKFEQEPKLTLTQRMAYFAGTNAPVVPTWCGGSLVGAILGERIPSELPLDFALPIAFLAIVAPAMRTLPHVIAALVAIAVALASAGLPYNLGLLVGSLAGMLAGARAEIVIKQRAAPQ